MILGTHGSDRLTAYLSTCFVSIYSSCHFFCSDMIVLVWMIHSCTALASLVNFANVMQKSVVIIMLGKSAADAT